jgi:hypothetical protein
MNITIDIETAPLPDDQLLAMLPPFDPAEVKTGNIKDEAKIAEKIALAEANHRANFIDRAALDARTGTVACIGWHDSGGSHLMLVGDIFITGPGDYTAESYATETLLIEAFYKSVNEAIDDAAQSAQSQRLRFITYNGHAFDWPFLIRRSWILGIRKIPMMLWRKGRYFGEPSLDLRELWQLGDREAHSGGLGGLARALGVGDKTASGKDWHKLLVADPAVALSYAANDLTLTAKCAEAMGL